MLLNQWKEILHRVVEHALDFAWAIVQAVVMDVQVNVIQVVRDVLQVVDLVVQTVACMHKRMVVF